MCVCVCVCVCVEELILVRESNSGVNLWSVCVARVTQVEYFQSLKLDSLVGSSPDA